MFLNPSTQSIDTKRPIIRNLMMDRQLKSNGLRLKDKINISPIYGKKRILKCMKTKYFIMNEENSFQAHTQAQVIKLPNLKNDEFLLELFLYHQSKISRNEESCRFLLQSKNEEPFILNGQLVLSAFIERGDKVVVGSNQFFFDTETGLEDKFYQIDLNKNIKAVESNLTILLHGETGTGKTFLAKEIHNRSGVVGPFVHINLSSFSPGLLESELFGHKKGAFTGAVEDKLGAFAQAQDGTLFIDEIDSLPWEIQTKLLLFLDDKTVRAVGANVSRNITTRIIFSSGQCLQNLVTTGKMRKDFYYRLNSGQSFKLHSLRDNTVYIKSFCQRYCLENNISMTSKLLSFYQTLPWPGNFRELKGHLEKKKVLCLKNKLDFDEHDEQLITQSSEILSFDKNNEIQCLEYIKKAYCKRIYHLFNENVKLAAQKLEVNPKTLKKMLDA